MSYRVGKPVRIALSFSVYIHSLTGRDLTAETLTVAEKRPSGVTVRDAAGNLVMTRQGTKLVCEDGWLMLAR